MPLNASCLRAIDGDTQVYRVRQTIRWPDETVVAERDFVVRLLGVDCPERRGEAREAGEAAKAFARSLLFAPGPVEVVLTLTGKKDVYGRWLGSVEVGGKDLATTLVEAGHGVYREWASHLAALASEL